MFALMILKKKASVSAPFIPEHVDCEVDLCFAKGMVGAIPVFDTYEDAVAYRGEETNVKIFEFQLAEKYENEEEEKDSHS